ncbi:MAG: hypothetical protein WCA21_14890 [Terracidiphilus sp.]
MNLQVPDKTRFRNVDLDITSKVDLQPLMAAMGKKISLSFVGRVKRMYYAHMDLAIGKPKSPDSAIYIYCKLIKGLPSEARELWDSAKIRTFDIGIDAPGSSSCYWSSISPKTLLAAAEINAQIAITIYGPMKKARGLGRKGSQSGSFLKRDSSTL